MKCSIDLSDEEYDALIEQFYKYFEDGYKFEEFLKQYLKKIGLDEVAVTPRSRDGGVDLTAIRPGIGDFKGQDSRKYCIQAKRYQPSSTINVKDVRELSYVSYTKKAVGIFITTAKFSKGTKEEFSDNQVTPIILIDGRTLIGSCIDNEIGFTYKPIFNSKSMDELMSSRNDVLKIAHVNNTQTISPDTITVEKKITANDIRARILSMPKIILDNIPAEKTNIEVCFNGEFNTELSINKGRNYLAKVTPIYRKYGLLAEDGTITPASAIWYYQNGKLNISISLL